MFFLLADHHTPRLQLMPDAAIISAKNRNIRHNGNTGVDIIDPYGQWVVNIKMVQRDFREISKLFLKYSLFIFIFLFLDT